MIQTERRLVSEHRNSDSKQLPLVDFYQAFITLVFALLFLKYLIINLK